MDNFTNDPDTEKQQWNGKPDFNKQLDMLIFVDADGEMHSHH
jgi:hypothetical protein